ncbi:MAG: glycosyltransferase family 2 protein [Nitrososphaerota archaeon]
MVSKDDVTIIIPTLNEEKAIGLVLDELIGLGYDKDKIIVVDGYSKDNTVKIALEKGVKVLYQHGPGKAGAIQTALESINTPYILVMDGDYTYDPRGIEYMLKHADKYDEIIGVRKSNISTLHKLGNRIINFTFNILFGSRLSDVCSGMYLIRVEALKDLEFKSRNFGVEVEIAAHISQTGRITEVPINYRKRIGGRKLKSFRDGLNIIRTILWLARKYNPILLFSTIASLMAIPGGIISLWQLYLRYRFGSGAWSYGWAWLGLTLLVIGLQGFTISTITLLLKRMETRIIQKIKSEKP